MKNRRFSPSYEPLVCYIFINAKSRLYDFTNRPFLCVTLSSKSLYSFTWMQFFAAQAFT